MDDEAASLALSELESLTVVDAAGREVGELLDVVVLASADPPLVKALVVETAEAQVRASWEQVAELDVDGGRVLLSCDADALEPASLLADELALVDAVLDNQVLDMRRRAFVRVQDVALEPRDGDLVVAGVDASTGALARRFGLGFLSRRLPRRTGDYVPWDDVNLISLRLSRLNFVEAFGELAELHPADIADIVSQVGARERAAVLAALNAPLAADTLQEMDDEERAGALVEMPVERAAKLLEKMDADVAADMLADLPEELAEELLSRQSAQRESDLRRLADHAEDSAGGLMTLEFVALPVTMAVGEALAWLRRERPDQHAMSYVYGVDDERRLLGVASLRELVLADQEQPLAAMMEDDLVTVAPDARPGGGRPRDDQVQPAGGPGGRRRPAPARHRDAGRRARRHPAGGLEAAPAAPLPLTPATARGSSHRLRRRPQFDFYRPAAARRHDDRGQVQTVAADLAAQADRTEAAALQDLGVEQVQLTQVPAEGVGRPGAPQHERLERGNPTVLERGLQLQQELLEATEVVLIVEVGAGEEPGVRRWGARRQPAGPRHEGGGRGLHPADDGVAVHEGAPEEPHLALERLFPGGAPPLVLRLPLVLLPPGAGTTDGWEEVAGRGSEVYSSHSSSGVTRTSSTYTVTRSIGVPVMRAR